ncbi:MULTISPECIES: hypothetical protein [Psychrobacter]|jgi:hypothetical protein|uniref:hypothetical protein n=1 Tax=Psychrobacter TaxID=497 RepID=UPI0004272541|nr:MULTISPECIES: hypothetical protein [Psychrobacter]NRD71219.1 hypothetical protein [Psychrobacter okhotskensis]PKG34537.1 hypothetical protein CXF65_13395 [Psychrobacter sp. Sarcosine-3u-12]
MSDVDLIKESEMAARKVFRFYSRKVFLAPNNRYFHEQRINAALLLNEKEPLQGAVADFFYGCWYDIPYDVTNLFTRIQDRLYPQVEQGFRDCINKKSYIQRNSMLATRWSVLVSPSLNEQTKRLRISSDDAKEIAKDITTELMQARNNQDWGTIEQIENEFFAHCIARHDRLAFSLVWFRLGKSDWQFDERWNHCQQRLDQTNGQNIKT